MTSTTDTEQAFARLADGLLDCIANMVTAREECAAEQGVTVTDEEIIASVLASLKRMMSA